ncbi:MAG: hypothetical protein ACLRSD_16265 [Oscillibacter sp.]
MAEHFFYFQTLCSISHFALHCSAKRGERDGTASFRTCDCNCFYASCELLSHPDLRQLPVAVCGDPTRAPRHHPGQK